MPKAKPFARIAVTLPEKQLAEADRLARRLDRSRSWVVAEAIRRYAAGVSADGSQADARKSPPLDLATPGLGTSRQAQLVRDLSLTPEQRVREADETLRLSERHRRARVHQLMAFDEYTDFLDWKYGQRLSR